MYSNQIIQHQDRLLSFYGKHGSNNLAPEHADRVVNMIVAWKWHLRAADSIEIDNGVIPLIIGTVLSYFLFIFQLQAAEN
ncbi:unnamed protein product [Allacma fusca]|uniref:Uncharacterized protein n=1 Tax=Allacma fusca TaxID=39272 RepID=A0A8J2NSX2_9HEXA|nr:unnamed protein product [Allacma fusca]